MQHYTVVQYGHETHHCEVKEAFHKQDLHHLQSVTLSKDT